MVGVLEIRKDAAFIDKALHTAKVRVLGTLIGIIATLTLAIALISRATVSRPLDRMLSGKVADLYTVRQYLDAERGGWA